MDSLSALTNCSLWFSGFDKLNDPFEATYELTAQMIFGDSNNLPKVHSTISTIINNSGVCCFSKIDPTDNIQFKDSTLMWSHYAEQFSGMCIEFEQDELLLSLRNNYDCCLLSQDVIYTNIAHDIRNFNDAKDEKIIFKKHDAWEYEKEYRIINTSSGKNRLLEYSPSAIKAIYVGGRVSNSGMSLIKIIRNSINNNIPIFSLSLGAHGYMYNINDFDES